MAQQTREAAQLTRDAVDAVSFDAIRLEMSNPAQEGGDVIATTVSLATGIGGLAKSGGKAIAKGVTGAASHAGKTVASETVDVVD
ncbi:hypothetical protein [Serratia microhaemolytica]|uniref:hypothetical protein n=1 Tax=Serratia microhaemolytica TaxID=2675110 RepID=UPI000FDDD2BB|nr:hypothetical protein [Serratia microhaemolytica]